MKKSNKGGQNVWSAWTYGDFGQTGEKQTKRLFKPNKFLVLVSNIRDRLTHHILRRMSISQLDKALEYKLPKSSRVSRAEARTWNEAIQWYKKDLRRRGIKLDEN